MSDKIAVDLRTALKMFYDQGFTFESDLIRANDIIVGIKPASQGYWLADDIVLAIETEQLYKTINPVN
jgi:hypothetical protein